MNIKVLMLLITGLVMMNGCATSQQRAQRSEEIKKVWDKAVAYDQWMKKHLW